MSRGVPPKLSITQSATLQQQLDGPQILIVDDEPVIGDICSRALTNCRVSQASDGRRALQLIDKTDFDLILTDVNMPDIGGIELLRTIKEKQPNQSVIIMTGYACRDTILEALKADADDFISKPINLLHRQTLVNKALEKKALKAELLQLKRMDRLKTDFLGMISHKLNNPVTAISLFFQNVGQGTIDLDDPSFREYLTLTHKESDGLLGLIQSLLVYSDLVLDNSPLKKIPTDLCRLTREVITEIQKNLDNKKLNLNLDCSVSRQPIDIDQQRIRFVIRALFENAINASADGESIHISLTTDASAATISIAITDSGPGIPISEQAKVFEKFYQIETSTPARAKGFGLGLYYARLFTRMHDGTLTLKSSPGSGTSAVISLPL
jgi:signal transduction histidine kinase